MKIISLPCIIYATFYIVLIIIIIINFFNIVITSELLKNQADRLLVFYYCTLNLFIVKKKSRLNNLRGRRFVLR